MKMKKILSVMLAGIMVLGAAACGGGEDVQRELTEKEIKKLTTIPDYSSVDKQYEFFAYSAASTGYWNDYGVQYYCGQDLRNVEQFKMHKESGLTMMHLQSAAAIQGGDVFVWETSELKRTMDIAHEAGVDKVIVSDYRLSGLSGVITLGLQAIKDGTFAEFDNSLGLLTAEGEIVQTALDTIVTEYMSEYIQHPSFYGVRLDDEPEAAQFVAYGYVYKTIERLFPDVFMLCNLGPVAGFEQAILGDGVVITEEDQAPFADTNDPWKYAAWKRYAEMFLDATGCDYLMYDQYPVSSQGMHYLYLRGVQLAAEICKERGVDFCLVAQTCAIVTPSNKNNTRIVNAEDAAWINNMLLGMGVKTIGYYTYFDRDSRDDQVYLDGAGFVTHFGEKTAVYYAMQKIMQQNQKMAPTLLSFDYTASSVYTTPESLYGAVYITNGATNAKFAKLAAVEINKESALVSELYDAANNRYMYMVQNIVDPMYTGFASYQKATLTFNEEYKYALVLSEGEQKVYKLVNNQFSVTQHPGKAVYVIPFN